MSLARIRTALRAAVAALTTTSLVLTAYPQPGTAQQLDPVLEGRTLGQQLTVDPKTLFELEDGTVTLQGGHEIPLDELFPQQRTGDATALEDGYGDEAATVDQGHAAQQRLADEPGGTGEAYRTLMASPYDGQHGLSTEPWYDNTRTILGDIDRLGGELGRCVPTQVIGTSPRTVHQPDLRICTRPANEPSTGACRLEHSASLSESQTHARVGVYGAITNTFELDFAAGSWRQIAPSDGSHFAGEVPKLDPAEFCGGELSTTFALQAAGTWPDAPLPGEEDETIIVRILQQPSCGNGLKGIVQLFDDGGDGRFKSTAELILETHTTADSWWPQSCLEIASGQELDPACTLTATAVAPPDADGCAIIDGTKVCIGDAWWQAMPPPPFDPDETHLSRLAGGADINWSCPATAPPVDVTDTCGPLRERPECIFKSSACIEGAVDDEGNCQAVEDTYDCGKEVIVDDGEVRTELQCDGEIKCLGDTCTDGTEETNPSFAETAATLKGLELAALDGACNPATGQCAIFTGQPASCKRVLAADIDCCADVQGVSLASYLELAFAVASLAGAMGSLDPNNPLRGGWEVLASPGAATWDWIGGQFTSLLNGVTGTTTPAAGSEAAMGLLGAAQQYMLRATAQWTLDTFGPAAANALFTVNGGAAVAADGTLAAGYTQLGGLAAAAGAALFWVGIAYTAYQVAMLAAQIIWACEDEELELAVKRELKQCRSLGSYCSLDSPLGCIEARRGYCCFASPFSRIMQEQLRPQLGLAFGDAEDPECAGIPIEDLSRIDWSKVDLDEWIAMLADNGQLEDAESITAERLSGNLRAVNAAAPAAGDAERAPVLERTLKRTEDIDVAAVRAEAKDELMPYLQPGAGAPKPQPETVATIPPELLQPWRLPNQWMEQPEPEPGEPGPIDPGPELPEPPPPAACSGSGARTTVDSVAAFQQALSIANPDDTIILAPGSYGGLDISKGGSATAPIYIAAAYPAVSSGAVPQSSPKSSITSIAVNAGNLVVCGLHFNAGAFTSARHGKDRTDNVSYVQNYFATGVINAMGIEYGIIVDNPAESLLVQANYFEARHNAGYAQDYGIALFGVRSAYIRGNVFDGVFNHAVSTKHNVARLDVTGNVFRGCGQACMHVGQTQDYDGSDQTGGIVTIQHNSFIGQIQDHPQGRSPKALVLRNTGQIVVDDNSFQGQWADTIVADFMNSGGIERVQGRGLGIWGTRQLAILIQNNTFMGGSLRFTGRGTGYADRIDVVNNGGTYSCAVQPFQEAEGRTYDWSTIDRNPPTVIGCTTASARAD